MGRPAGDKRERLVAAAVTCFHRRGYARTALADVAREAGLSPGHVYYHFRTKEDLGRAVIDAWCARLEGLLAGLEDEADGWARLERFVEGLSVGRETYVALGCPLAGLVRDLRREGGALAAEAPRVYAVQEAWIRARFAELDFDAGTAGEHARALMAGHHGAILLAHAQDDETVIADAAARLRAWLSGLRG